jgi:hypothetical protein
MQVHGSSQVSPQSAAHNGSVRASAPTSGAEAEVYLAGVAQLVEHLFCKQVVRGSSPRASSDAQRSSQGDLSRSRDSSESCPSGQREQAVNLPAYAYAGSNPALSTTTGFGELSSPSAEVNSAEPPPQVLGPRPQNFPSVRLGTNAGARRSRRMHRAGVAQLVERQPSKLNVESSSLFSRSVPSHENVTSDPAHLAQLVEHVLGKDEVTSSILVVGSKP